MRSNKNSLHKVDLNLLVAFDVLMTERSVTQAGRAMGITQAAMSNTLKRLRQTFNDPLFVKDSHTMAPTAMALKLEGPIAKVLDHAERLLKREQFDSSTSDRLFRVALSNHVASTLIPPLLDRLEKTAPKIRLEVFDPGGTGQAKVLDRGDADLLITWFQWVTSERLRLHRLFEVNCVCMARRGNPHVGKKLSMEGFLAADHVQFLPPDVGLSHVDEALLQQGYTRKVVGRLGHSSIISHLIAASDLLTVLPDRLAHYLASRMDLEVHALPFAVVPLRIAMAWHARTDESAPDRWLRNLIIELTNQGTQNTDQPPQTEP